MGGATSHHSHKQKEADKFKNVLATIGCAGSGKSTFCHQMCYPIDASEALRQEKCPQIFSNVVLTMKSMTSFLEEVSTKAIEAELTEFEKWADAESNEYTTQQAEWGQAITATKKLYDSTVFQSVIPTYKAKSVDRDGLNLANALAYFMREENYVRLIQLGYTPSLADIAHAREVTIHGVEKKFAHEVKPGLSIDVFMKDLGGQIMQREQWHAAIQESNAILYIISLDYTDKSEHSSLQASLDLACAVSEAQDAVGIPFIMVFNKTDIFRSKIKTEPLTDIPGLTWKKDCTDAQATLYLTQIKQWFVKAVEQSIFQRKRNCSAHTVGRKGLSKMKASASTEIQVYDTCALDRNLVHNVMNAVMQAITEMSVDQSF